MPKWGKEQLKKERHCNNMLQETAMQMEKGCVRKFIKQHGHHQMSELRIR